MNLGRWTRQRLGIEPHHAQGKSDPPPPPDYRGAAQEQGQANLDAAIATGIMNRPNQVNPLGSQTWTQTGTQYVNGRAIPMYTGTTSLTEDGQQLFDKNLSLQKGMMDLGDQSLVNAQSALNKPFDPTANRDAIVDAMYNRSKRLLDPYYAQQDEANESRLIAKGFSVGNKGYTDARADFQRGKDNAYMDAQDRAMTSGAQQAIQEALISRQQPLTELNAIRTGAMPTLPQFGNQAQAGGVGAAPIAGAASAAGDYAGDVYNAKVGQENALMGTAATLGAGYLGGSALGASLGGAALFF